MKTIIAGSRTIIDLELLEKAIELSCFEITEVFSGCASGVDTLGENWAIKNNISIRKFPADWDKHGKKAGILRNIQMGDEADALIAIWDGVSRGTKHMIDYATKKNLKVYVYTKTI